MPSRSLPRKRLAFLLLLLSTAAAAASSVSRQGAGFTDLSDPAPAVALEPPAVPDAASVRCAGCHAAAAAEWAASAHGIAWLDHPYQAALAERTRPELCAGCHVPTPLLAEGELPRQPKAREDAQEPRAHGITCASCHQGAGDTVLGPRGSETPAHPTGKSAYLAEKSSELCATCHKTNIGPVVGIAKDFPESKAAAEGGSCVGCHMRPIERAWANAEGVAADASVPERVGRSHALQTPRDPAFLRRAFELSYRVEGGSTTVVVKNRTGHRVPGLQGRSLTFRFEALKGAATAAKGELVLDVQAYLPVDGEKTVTLSAAADTVRVRAEHVDPRASAPVVFLEGDVARGN
jgi:hypothetical protein